MVTKKNCVEIAGQIVEEYADKLFAELDIPPVTIEVFGGFCSDDTPALAGRFMSFFTGLVATLNNYRHDKSFIQMYPESELYTHFTNTIRIRTVFTEKKFKERFLNSLAHEIRHAYQYYYGVHIDKLDLIFNTTPYKYKRTEIDAREYAKEYVERMKEVL